MAFQVVRSGDPRIPQPKRNKKKVLESTDEWLQLKAKLSDGLRPYEELLTTFTAEDIQKIGIKNVGRLFVKLTREYVKKLGLQVDVWRYHSDGLEVIRVQGQAMHGTTGKTEVTAAVTQGTPATPTQTPQASHPAGRKLTPPKKRAG